MITKLINDYKNFESKNIDDLEKSKKIQLNYSKILEESKLEFSKISFIKRLFASGKQRKIILELTEFLENEEIQSKKIENTVLVKKDELYKKIINQLINEKEDDKKILNKINERLTDTTKIYNTFKKTVQSGEYAYNQIKDAIDSIESAETMETLDLFTQNKTISVLSSVNVSSAKDDVSDANESIKKLKKELEYTKLVIKDLELDSSWGTFDFVVDMFTDSGFLDLFGSIMVLDSLSTSRRNMEDAKNKVNEVVNKLKKEFDEIKKQLKEQENIKNNFIKNFEIQAEIIMKENSIYRK